MPVADNEVVNEAIWRAWVQTGRRREKATARLLRLIAGIALGLFALGGTFYLLAAG